MLNAPDVKLALVGVSRDCFPIELTRTRLGKLAEACKKIGLDVYVAETVIVAPSSPLAQKLNLLDPKSIPPVAAINKILPLLLRFKE